MDPWGTPHIMFDGLELLVLILILNFCSLRYDLNRSITFQDA